MPVQQLTKQERIWANARIGLGPAQTMGATMSLVLLIRTGTGALTASCTALTIVALVASFYLFHVKKLPNQ